MPSRRPPAVDVSWLARHTASTTQIRGDPMAKPLHEMSLLEVLEVLTPAQKQSILVHARQLAKPNLAAVPGNRDAGPDSATRKDQATGVARPIANNRLKPQSAPATAPLKAPVSSKTSSKASSARRLCSKCGKIFDAGRYDEHVKSEHGPASNPLFNNPPTDIKSQKSEIHKDHSPGLAAQYPPGYYIDGRKRTSNDAPRQARVKGISQSARANTTPQSKRSVKPPKEKRKKGAKAENKAPRKNKKSRFRKRFLQGGLCSPR